MSRRRGDTPLEVSKRHWAILALWMKGYSVCLIASIVGLKDHSSVIHHVNGHCKCEAP